MATTNQASAVPVWRPSQQARPWQPERLEPRRLLSSLAGAGVRPPSEENISVEPAAGTAVPVLHSFVGAPRTLFLDFDGDNSTRQWNGVDPGLTPPYDEDGDPTAFSDTELEGIREIWARVAEKFSPFRLDVTTVDPGTLVKGTHGRIVIGGRGMWHDSGADGGVSQRGGFFDVNLSNTSWVFPLALTDRKAVAEGAAHEAGHLFDLRHQSLYGAGGVKLAEYHPGNADRAPIMGDSANSTRGVWWIGNTGDPPEVTAQNDLFILENKLGYRVDDHTDVAANAPTPLVVTGTGSLFGSGVIARGPFGFDRDVFSFPFSGGDLKLTVSPSPYGGMLDATVSVYRQGVLFGRSDTAALEETVFVENASAGSYTVVVEGNAAGDVGRYTVTCILDASWDNSLATAVRVGGDLIERPFTGWRSFHDPYIGSNDPDDFYRFVTDAAPSVFTAELYNVAADVRMYLIHDHDHDGWIDGDETVASSSQTSATSELIANVPLAARTVYYVNVHRFGSQSSYDLNLFTDYAPGSLSSARLTGPGTFFLPRGETGYEPLDGEFAATDFVDGGDRDDFYRVALDAPARIDVALTGMTGDADLSLVHDANRNGAVDLGEVVETSAVGGSADEAITNYSASVRGGGDYFVRVRAKAGAFTNYSLRIRADYAGQTLSTSRPLGQITGGSRWPDYVGAADESDVYSFQASAGTLKAFEGRTGHTLDLIRDINGNGLVDARETFASGPEISAVLSADAATYYLRVRRTPGEFPSNGNYGLVLIADPGSAGDSAAVPKTLPTLTVVPLVFLDHVARRPGPTADERDDPHDFYRFGLEATRRVVLSLDGMSGDANLELIRDVDGDGAVDRGDVLVASARRGSAPESVARTLGPGQYLVHVLAAAVGEAPGSRSGVAGPEGSLRPDASVTNYRLTLQSLAPVVAARHLFYNNSAFDAYGASADAQDDGALVPDKQPLLPGQTASFSNVSSYSRGINGIMIDTTAFAAEPSTADFDFRSGNSGDPATWAQVAAVVGFARRSGEGASGSDRITLTWPDGAIRNTWLQITVRANANTGLASPEVFYFGNLVGEAGDSASALRVSAFDMLAVRRGLFSSSPVSSRYDIDRDGRVDVTDTALARAAIGRTLATPVTPAPQVVALTLPPLRRASTRRGVYELLEA